MVHIKLFCCVFLFSFIANAQVERKSKPNTTQEHTIWRMLDGYPKEHPQFTEGQKKNFTIDIEAGTVMMKGYYEPKKTTLTQLIKFSPFPKEMLFDFNREFYVNATNNVHDAQGFNLEVSIKMAKTNKAETYYEWVDLVGMSCDESQHNKSVDYKSQVSLNMGLNSECLIFAIRVGFINATGSSLCFTHLFKYEKITTTDEESIDCKYIPPIRKCKKTFFLKGKRNDGTAFISNLNGTKLFYEMCPDQMDKTALNDSIMIYDGYDYTKIANPSYRQDCAGYVFEKLWGKGKNRFGGDTFYRAVLLPFAKNVGSLQNSTLIDIQKGDVVAYINNAGIGGHIAFVRDVIKNSDGTIREIVIETKNGSEAVYITKFIPGKLNDFDPLISKFGVPHFFRINLKEIELLEKKVGDCD